MPVPKPWRVAMPLVFAWSGISVLTGCSGFGDSTRVHHAIQTAISHTVDSIEQAVMTTSAFRQTNGKWPQDLDQLKGFALEHKLPIDLVKSLDLTPQPDGGVVLDGTATPMDPSDEPSKFHVILPADMDITQAAKVRAMLNSGKSVPR